MIRKKNNVNSIFLQLSGGMVAGVVMVVAFLLSSKYLVQYQSQGIDGVLILVMFGGCAALFIGSMYCWARVLVRFGMLEKREIKDYVFLRLGTRNG